MRTWSFVWAAVLGLVALGGAASAEDVSGLKDEIANLRAKIVSLENARMAPAGGDAESLTSMKKKGAIRIGGKVEVAIRVVNRDDQMNAANNSDDDEVNSTQFNLSSGSLFFRVNAGPDTYLHIKLDLDDLQDSRISQDELLEEVYFMWKHVRGSNWDLRFGKGEVAFGQDKDILITNGYHHGSSGTYLGRGWEENSSAPASEGTGTGNPKNMVGDFAAPSEIDNVFMIEATYTWKDLAKWEVALFQNRSGSTGGAGRLTRGMHEDRSDDTLFFQSFATRLTLTPVEGLKIKLSGVNLHNDSRGDRDLFTTGDPQEDEQALSIAFDYKCRGLPLEFFGEYSHGFGWNFNDDYDTNTSQLGLIWGVAKRCDLVLIGEWMDIDDDRVAAMRQNEDYWKLALAGFYHFDNGIRLSLEYIHEWYDRDSNAAGDDVNSDADAIVFGTTWKF